MLEYTCDQLFLNDTEVPDEEVKKALKAMDTRVSYELVSDSTLVDVWDALSWWIRWTIILPWSWWDIYKRYVDLAWFVVITVNPTRKLINMSPRWLVVCEEDRIKLRSLWDTVTFCDDVIASWTTVNWTFKCLPPNASNDWVISTLVLRSENQLKKWHKPKVKAWLTVEKEWWWYPRINTLSSLFLESKRGLLLQWREENYWWKFVTEIKNLFTLS